MWRAVVLLGKLLSALCRNRMALACENIALRHQLEVLTRKTRQRSKLKLKMSDRMLWVVLSKLWPDWRKYVRIVQPKTVVKWHRTLFRAYWRRKCERGKVGREPIPLEIRRLIQQMSITNPLWGAPHIQGELEKLGVIIAESTIDKYRVMPPHPPSQGWKTFLLNHLPHISAMDFFTVPTATFKVLYVFVILSLDRRKILHVNVTASPNSRWIVQQLREAYAFEPLPQYLQRDRDGVYGNIVKQWLRNMDIKELVSAPQSPWQNGYVERVIGSIRRECTDHIIPLSEEHLQRVLHEYVEYYNHWRTHLSLNMDTPEHREVQCEGRIAPRPLVGGLHTCFTRCA